MAKSSFFLLASFIIFTCEFPRLQAHNNIHNIPQSNTTPQKKTINVIDSCWRSSPTWASNRLALADCARGFGNNALGGKSGTIYTVTDPSDDPVNPKPGTLRYGAIQHEPLWIIFERDMNLTLGNVLLINSYKTIDGRGVKVEIANGPCIIIQGVSHVIVHGISIHDCKPGNPSMVRRSPDQVGTTTGGEGDGITVSGSSDVWIDHCYFAHCTDGLVDIIEASTNVTISNNYFTQHDEVMLFGHQDGYTADQIMKVTVALNYFGPGLVQRMPRVRYGYAHVTNNLYDQWLLYAIGGSSNPTILSEGNYFMASNNIYTKQVTRRDPGVDPNEWKNWNWRSSNDIFLNGAYFVQSGNRSCSPLYSGSQLFSVASGSLAPSLTSDAGPLNCFPGEAC